MTPWIQHLLVFLLVAASLGLMIRQAISTFRAGKGGFGSCCAKGCSSGAPKEQKSDPSTAPAPERIVFLPVEMLRKRR